MSAIAASDTHPLYGYCPNCGRALEGENLDRGADGTRTPSCAWCLVESDDATQAHPVVTATDQITEANIAVDRDLRDYLHLPFHAVDALVGGIPPGDVGFVAAFSGQGKTTWIASAIIRWLSAGKKVYCLPLESEPLTFRTNLACKTLGLHAGKVLTGEYKRTLDYDAWKAMRGKIRNEIDSQCKNGMDERLFVSPTLRMDTRALTKAAEHAAKLGADVFIIDHIDHVSSAGKTGHAESVSVVDGTLDLTRDLGLHTIATSQLNHEGVKGDRLGMYQCPQPHHLYMGGKKRQVAAWMIGLFRPLKFSEPLDKDLLKQARNGTVEPWRVLEPNCMGVGVMKSRHFGERETRRAYLEVKDGCVTELDEALQAQIDHGIRTKRW